MNALEQKYLDKKVDEWQSEHLDFRGVAQTARYFYNLALADVRGEVEKHAKTYANTISGAEWRKTLDFIDNLTK